MPMTHLFPRQSRESGTPGADDTSPTPGPPFSRGRRTQKSKCECAVSEEKSHMWENRCKVAVSGVGFSKVTRSAEVPLAAHALTAVKEAVADSGLEMSDIDGLATYPELPATGHAEVDGISIVSVNCMMA